MNIFFWNTKQCSWFKSPDIAEKYSETSVRTIRQNDIASHKRESFSVHVVVIWDLLNYSVVCLQRRFGEIPSLFREVVRYILPKHR
jgi:hypothetical protein